MTLKNKMKRSKKIITTLPLNVPQDQKWIFERRSVYFFPKLKIAHRKNIFLSHYGIALKYLLPIKRTLPNSWGFGKPNAGFIFQFYRKALEIYLVCKFGKSLKAIALDHSKNYLFIYSPWFGYFSWVTESLPRILEVKDRHKELTLILPESYSKLSFVMKSLELFPELKYEIIPDGIHMKVPRVVIPELKPSTYAFDPNTMQNYRAQMWIYIENMQIDIQTYDKIYVSRKKAKNRKLLNEKEVLELLAEHEFQEIAFENYSFFEQIYLMKNCKVLTGVHGAGFANIAFMGDDTALIELIKEYSSYKEERPSYWRLCSALNIDYYIEYCKPEKYGSYDLWVGVNLKADIDKFAVTLEQIKNKNLFSILS